MKNTISSVIKDVLSQKNTDESKNNLENIVAIIKEKVPNDVKIKTSEVDDQELQNKIKETVGKILTDEEINSIVQLRNISSVNGKSITPTTTTMKTPATSSFEVNSLRSILDSTLNDRKDFETLPSATANFDETIELKFETSSFKSTTTRKYDENWLSSSTIKTIDFAETTNGILTESTPTHIDGATTTIDGAPKFETEVSVLTNKISTGKQYKLQFSIDK